MLCACSGEKFQFEDAPQSPESLATRDFSASGISSKTADWETRFDDSQVDDVESTLKETLSLNYEEARALLGRLEYQRGNIDAALEVFQGIDVRDLKPRMSKAIIERTRPRRNRCKGEILQLNTMSLHSVSLLLEAILLKSKTLEELGRDKEAALECTNVLDIVEAAWPNGMPESIGDDCKLKEVFHKALEFLPKLWKQAGCLEEAITSYRKALMKPWNLDPQRLAELQKDLATALLYGGYESTMPSQLQQIGGSNTLGNNMEEAILLLCILMGKVVSKEIEWDPEIVEHLSFALSTCGQFGILADNFEQILPGFYNRGERWYLLALCYSAAGQDDVALNLLRKACGCAAKKHKCYLPSLLLATKLCAKDKRHANEGTKLARRALMYINHREKHFMGVINLWLGVCYIHCSRSSITDTKRVNLQKESLKALNCAAAIVNDDPEVMFNLAVENARQRNLDIALENAVRYSDLVAGSCLRGWKLLALIVSAEKNFKDAEAIVDLALDETGIDERLELLRLKALLQNSQEKPKNAIETYKNLLAVVQAQKELRAGSLTQVIANKNFETEAWLDLSSIYIELGLLSDSEICLDKAKSVGYFSPRSWHIAGKLLDAQALRNDALLAFSISLTIEPDYVPSMVSTAAILLQLGRTSLPIARSFLMNALRLDPMNHDAWLNLGHVSKAEGLLRQAADCFQAAYELKQSSPMLDIT